MKTTIESLSLLIILSLGISESGLCFSAAEFKSDTSYFKLIFITYNHAERVFDGTMSYSLSNSYVVVSKQQMFSEKDSLLYKARIDSKVIDKIDFLELEGLNENYYNNCVVITSGDEYFISQTIDNSTKKIHLHQYYLKKVEELVFEINSLVPEKYRIDYVTKDTEQDCKS